MSPITVLIKPASSLCNLRCDYCFYLDSAKNRDCGYRGIMSLSTLENVIKKALNMADGACTFAFQGGEPTLAGLDFFEAVTRLQKEHNIKNIAIHNAIQTNGLNIDEKWARYYHENKFLVGVSLDGTRESHNAFRTDTNGKGSFARVMSGIELLKKYKVEFNILTVVHSRTARKIQSIYEFYKKNDFDYLQFIPCLQPFGQEDVKNAFTLSAKDYGNFLNTLFDLWYRDFTAGQAPHIRQFENYTEMLLGYPPESCGMSGVCGVQYVVESDGQVYPCDFYALDSYALGNLNEVDFAQVDRKRQDMPFFGNEIPARCRACKHFSLCRGGCKRYCEPFIGNQRGENPLCKGYYQFFEHCTERLKQLSALYRIR